MPEESSVLLTDAADESPQGEIVDAGEVEETEEDAASDSGEVNPYESDDNPYKRKAQEVEENFKRLQGRVQREIEEKRQLAQYVEQYEEWILQQRTSQLPPQERQQEILRYRQDQYARQQQQQLQAQQAQQEEIAKVLVAKEFAQQYGVPHTDLLAFPDVTSMETHAKSVAALRRQQKKQQRRETRADAFEGNVTGTATVKPPQTIQEAGDSFEKMARKLGFA